jgi:hypothetical protein
VAEVAKCCNFGLKTSCNNTVKYNFNPCHGTELLLTFQNENDSVNQQKTKDSSHCVVNWGGPSS